jgi:AraC-like DNA-binding protein
MRLSREQTAPPPGHSFRVLRWKRRLSDIELLLDGGKTARFEGEGDRWHFHSAMELTLFSDGHGTRFVGDHIGSFGAGDLVLLGAGLPHYWHVRGPSSGVSLQWDFAEGHPFWEFPEVGLLRALFQKAARGLRISGEFGERLGRAVWGLGSLQGARRLAALMAILGELAEAPGNTAWMEELSQNGFQMRDEGGHQKALGEAVRYLLAHFRSEVRLARLLEITGMSKSTFARQFQRHSGKTFQEFVLSLRVQAACRELAHTHAPVLEIAQESGFSEVSFFNRAFRRLQGCTPTEYRRRLRGA